MDAYEATRVVFSRIQNLDPENASKIMGLLLIQDHGEKEMIRLAFGPEALVHSVIFKARKDLGLAGNSPSTPSTPSSPSPFLAGSQISLSRQNSSSSSSRLGGGGISLPSPLSIPNPNSSSAFSDYQSPLNDLISPNSSSFPNNGISNFSSLNSSSPLMNPSSPFYGGTELIDDFQLQDHLSFLNDGSPNLAPKNPEIFYPQQELGSSPNANSGDPMLFPPYGSAAGDWGGSVNGLPHRRSCSVSDICLGSDDSVSGLGWKPCLYFARGFCKNGTSCRFLHGGLTDPAGMVGGSDAAANLVGSPNKLDMMEQCQELLIRSKSAQQQQRLAAMASASFPYSSNKCMNFLLQQQQQNDSHRAATALTMGDDLHKFGRSRLERNHFGMNGALDMNPGSRQIYLTFPADSTFREEDVSNYFSIYGPVQDVRIPYQQKRMFGFVTFVYPETVKIILAKGNPHFVCDARVLVKPYKEKGKVPDKYRKQQQVERGDFSSCNSPTGLDGRDPYDVQLGPRMFYNTQDMLWRRKLEEQADLQQALELQSRRLMSLQLLDVKKHHHHRTLSTGGAPIGSPVHSPNFFNHSVGFPSERNSPEDPEDKCSSPAIPARATGDQQVQKSVNVTSEKELTGSNENGNESPHNEGSDVQESVDHNLPDSPFASATGDSVSAFAFPAGEAEKPVSAAPAYNNNLIAPSLLPATSTLDMASFKSCYFQMPRLSGHGAIGM